MGIRSIPDIQIVTVRPQTNGVSAAKLDLISPKSTAPAELRLSRVKEFLIVRSLAPKSERAYRQDLQRFLVWTDSN